MKSNTLRTTLVALATLTVAVPFVPANAQSWRDNVEHRKQKRDEWKNIAIGSGAAAVLGLLTKNGTITTLGTAGALYSAWRYEEDRKSANRMDRMRAEYYSRPSMTVNGHRYRRRTVYKNGQKYYQFVKAR